MSELASQYTGKSVTRNSERERVKRLRDTYLSVFVFLVPGMILFFVMVLIPVAQSLDYSRYDWNGLGPPIKNIGLNNYDFLIHQKAFQQSISNSLRIVALSVGIQLPLALGLALVVGRGDLPGRAIFRTILFIPFVFSEILTGLIWNYVYHPREGLINALYHLVDPGATNLTLLAERNLALYAVFAVITWKFFGLHMILYMAALQGVPKDLEEAARMDGASELQVIRRITLPLIGPTLRLTVYLSVLGSFQQFVLIWVMTTGGPANATQVLGTYLYKFGIISWKLGMGSAIAVLLFIITFTFSILYQTLVMRRDYDPHSV